MIVAAMQPYFFPYLGYFQLMAQCQKFILLDDVQYVARRWINRNRILSGGVTSWLTYPVVGGHQTATIREREYVGSAEARTAILNKVREAYRRAPHYDEVSDLVQYCLNCGASSVADVNGHLLRTVAPRLHLTCDILMASELVLDRSLRGQARILSICRQLGATEYVNAIGGVSLYREEDFASEGIRLSFLCSGNLEYPQFGDTFVPALSVIDTLMFTNRDLQADLLSRCRRLSPIEAAESQLP